MQRQLAILVANILIVGAFLSNIVVFAFLIEKLQHKSSSCSKPVSYICFCFSTYKNNNTRAAMLAAGILAKEIFLSNIFLASFAKIVTQV